MNQTIAALLLLFSFAATGQPNKRVQIDALLGRLAYAKEDSNKVHLLESLSFAYSDIHPDSGILMANLALKLSEKIEWEKGMAVSYADLAINYQSKAEHKKALEYHFKALKLYEKLGAKQSAAAILSNIALVYSSQSNYALALDYYHRALHIFESLGERQKAAITLENIGTLYLEQKDYVKTKKYYYAAIAINKKTNDKVGLSRNMGNVGILYDAQGQYPKALQHHFAALAISRELGNKNALQKNLVNVGIVFHHMQKHSQALRYLLEALKISEELGNKNSIAINSGNIGELYFELAKTDLQADAVQTNSVNTNLARAIRHLERAVAMCIETGYLAPATEFIPYLSEAYSLSGNYKKAYEAHKEYIRIKDSVFSLRSVEQMAVLENKRLTELHEKNLQLKNNQIKIAKLEIKQKKNERVLYVLGIILLLLILVLSVVRIRKYRISNRILADEKAQHRKIISAQSHDLDKRKKVLEEIAHKQSHDIRGHVATILGLADLFNNNNLSDPVNKRVVEGIQLSAQQLDVVIKEVVKKENDLNA